MIILEHYKDQVVGVFGLGKAGLATIESLAKGGAKVVAWDDSETNRKQAQDLGLDVRFYPPQKWPWDHLDLIVLSPGVPLNYPEPHEVANLARQYCLPIVGDVELLYQQCPYATYVAITGTNGKSTTTTLIGHILKHAGRRVQVGGNIGVAALTLEPAGDEDIYVLELSSYQLDLLATTCFDIAVMLNISPDHIDRHGSLEGYIAAKQHIFDHQTEDDRAIIAVDDEYTKAIAEEVSATPAMLTTTTVMGAQADISINDGVLDDADYGFHLDLKSIRHLQGAHNWQNAVTAYSVAKALGVSAEQIKEAMESFAGLQHRMEWVAEMAGITFINDSKATNADAASHALAAWNNIYWIVGGVAKEGGIEALEPHFSKVKRAYLIGESEDVFAETLGGGVMYAKCETLEQAVVRATEDAMRENAAGGVVMLSPACASFDQYKNFEARGDHFKQLVGQLKLAA